jgi:hypothetical protein
MSMLSTGLATLWSGAGRILTGGLTGGIPGAIGGAIGTLAGTSITRATPTLPVQSSPGGLGGIFGGTYNLPVPPVYGPGGVQLPGTGGYTGSTPTACPRGYHLNKHALAASRRHGAVPAHSMCVRNRSINPLNHRALSRSLKRLKRAGKLVRKLHGVGGQRRLTAGSSGGHRPGCGCFRCRKR